MRLTPIRAALGFAAACLALYTVFDLLVPEGGDDLDR